MNKTIEKRQTKEKELLLTQLRKVPIIETACQMINVSRATFYRWRDRDEKFRAAADKALAEGASLVSDVAESQLLTLIKDGNLGAIVFWLRNHHPAYTNKLEVTAQLKNIDEKLTPEQESLINKALQLANLISSDKEAGEAEVKGNNV